MTLRLIAVPLSVVDGAIFESLRFSLFNLELDRLFGLLWLLLLFFRSRCFTFWLRIIFLV